MSRATEGGQSRGSAPGLYTMPGESILYAQPALPRSQFTQALIDIVMVVFALFFLCSVACSVPVAIFLLLFV